MYGKPVLRKAGKTLMGLAYLWGLEDQVWNGFFKFFNQLEYLIRFFYLHFFVINNLIGYFWFLICRFKIGSWIFYGKKLTDSRCFAAGESVSTNEFVTVSLNFKSSAVVFGRLSSVQTVHVKGWSCDFQIIFSSLDDAEGWGSVDLQKSLW